MTDTPERVTTESGNPVYNNQNSLIAGPRGPMLIQDYALIEKRAHFNRERVPERVVHAKDYGAHGAFTVTHDISKWTRAKLFSKVGNTCPMLSRFSTVGGESGSADMARDPRGFSLKFYTEEGNWDLVGNNTPIFFIRDPLKFSDFIHTQKPDPGTHLKPHWRRWDYWESVARGDLPSDDPVLGPWHAGVRPLHARLQQPHLQRLERQGRAHMGQVPYDLPAGHQERPRQGGDPDHGGEPRQLDRRHARSHRSRRLPALDHEGAVMPERDAETYKRDPFDLAKIWPHEDCPPHKIGVMELNRNVDDYFAEIEQASFKPSNVVPGIGFSPDKVLQNRILSYGDAHRYRMGVNYQQIPVNRPLAPVATYNRDGAMRVDGNGGSGVDYEPNGFGGPAEDPSVAEPSLQIDGNADRYTTYPGDDVDLYAQPGALWEKVLDDQGRANLVEKIVGSLNNPAMGMADGAKLHEIQERMLEHCYKVYLDFVRRIAEWLGLSGIRQAAE